MSWRAVVHSAIGTRHYQRQLPCQDYGQYFIADAVMVGAVADGAGSARYAEVGAKLAVQTALTTLQRLIEPETTIPVTGVDSQSLFPWQSEKSQPQPDLEFADLIDADTLTEAQAQQIFTYTVVNVVEALQVQASTDGHTLADLACTLLVFLATPNWMAAMQIGDGFLVIGTAERDYELLFQPAKGEYINETCFVTSAAALEQMQVKVHGSCPQFICAATDGLEKVAIRLQDWVPFPPFFHPLVEWIRTDPEVAATCVQNFLESERLNARTDDDKTLLLCYYSEEEPA
uniref:PPM-type phosphatase domain-containing protein n=1 Tax=Cyanothece sp. (strain PCC 7425 / ATCC 29141) TaxID=395961 RepID=B8HU32_CYAP4